MTALPPVFLVGTPLHSSRIDSWRRPGRSTPVVSTRRDGPTPPRLRQPVAAVWLRPDHVDLARRPSSAPIMLTSATDGFAPVAYPSAAVATLFPGLKAALLSSLAPPP